MDVLVDLQTFCGLDEKALAVSLSRYPDVTHKQDRSISAPTDSFDRSQVPHPP